MRDEYVAFVGRWWDWDTFSPYWQAVVEHLTSKWHRPGIGKRVWEGTKVYDHQPFDGEAIYKEVAEQADTFQAHRYGWIWEDKIHATGDQCGSHSPSKSPHHGADSDAGEKKLEPSSP